MEKKSTEQDENPLSQRTLLIAVFFAIIFIVSFFTIVFHTLSFQIPKGNAHMPKGVFTQSEFGGGK